MINEELSPEEKIKQCEMFADAILKTYDELYLSVFTGLCSINMNKMEILDKDGVIRLAMVVAKDKKGELTVSEYFIDRNKKISEVFTLTDEMRTELRGPLIAVLMEKGISEPTPTIKLLMTVGKHIFMGFLSAKQLKDETNDAIKTFKEFRKREIADKKAKAARTKLKKKLPSKKKQQKKKLPINLKKKKK